MPPAVIAAISIASTVISTGVAVNASIQQGKQQKAAADFQSRELQQQAMEAQQQAGLQVSAQDQRALMVLSSIRASAAASGVDVSSGSPNFGFQTNTEQAELNDMYTKYAANIQAQGIDSQAQLTEYGGKNAEKAGYYTAAGDVIQGAGNLATIYGVSKYGKNNPYGINN